MAEPVAPALPDELEVLIVGAGVSGIGAGVRLAQRFPTDRIALVEARDEIGGTWDLFRYPGIRSDSDMFTFSYPFRPWPEASSLGQGAHIRRYLHETAGAYRLTERIHLGTRVVRAEWSSEDARWRVELAGRTAGTLTARFLYLATGYYRYDHGHLPEFPGREDFTGVFVHPQFWPENLEVEGRRVVVIGSGATAATLVPALARRGARVTMLQRSPAWYVALPEHDGFADRVRRLLPARAAHRIIRAKNVVITQGFYGLCRLAPGPVGRELRRRVAEVVGTETTREHFTPRYRPWDQRVCVLPDGDLFADVRDGRVELVTDTIERFVPEGIRLCSGRTLPADVVVSATGLSLLAAGGIELTVDGEPVRLGERLSYRGLMIEGVPNLAYAIGYTNASWTLRSDLTAVYVCRLLSELRRRGAYAVPEYRRHAQGHRDEVATRPLLDLAANYILRDADQFPRRASHAPWTLHQNHLLDWFQLCFGSRHRDLTFRPAPRRGGAQPEQAHPEQTQREEAQREQAQRKRAQREQAQREEAHR